MLSIGLGITKISSDVGGDKTETGLAGLNVDLGTYLNPDLAVFVSIGGTNLTIDTGIGDLDLINGYFGLVGQYWVNEKITVGGGAGIAFFGPTDSDQGDMETGLALIGRATYRIAGGWQGMFVLAPNLLEDGTVTSTSFLAAYQWD